MPFLQTGVVARERWASSPGKSFPKGISMLISSAALLCSCCTPAALLLASVISPLVEETPSPSLFSESTWLKCVSGAIPRASEVLETRDILFREKMYHMCFCCADLWVYLEYDPELHKSIKTSLFIAQRNLHFPVGFQACRYSGRKVSDHRWCPLGDVTFPIGSRYCLY